LFDGIVKDVKPWHSGYDIEFGQTFATKYSTEEGGQKSGSIY